MNKTISKTVADEALSTLGDDPEAIAADTWQAAYDAYIDAHVRLSRTGTREQVAARSRAFADTVAARSRAFADAVAVDTGSIKNYNEFREDLHLFDATEIAVLADDRLAVQRLELPLGPESITAEMSEAAWIAAVNRQYGISYCADDYPDLAVDLANYLAGETGVGESRQGSAMKKTINPSPWPAYDTYRDHLRDPPARSTAGCRECGHPAQTWHRQEYAGDCVRCSARHSGLCGHCHHYLTARIEDVTGELERLTTRLAGKQDQPAPNIS